MAKDFTKVFDDWKALFDADQKAHLKNIYGMFGRTLDFQTARRWIKVWKTRNGVKESIFAFVDPETGDIYKPADTKRPANGVRGNVFDHLPVGEWELYR